MLLVAWAVVELGFTAADVYDFARTALNPDASSCDVALSGAFLAAGLVLPGGGYGSLSKIAGKIATGHAFTKHIDEFKHLGITTKTQFEKHLQTVMQNPTEFFKGK